MPVDHHAAATVAGMPLRHEVSIPSAEFRGIRCAGGAGRAPDLRIANGQSGVGHPGTGRPQGAGIDVSPVDMGELVNADICHPGGDSLEPGVGANRIEGEQQAPVAHIVRQRFAAGRTFKAVEELRVERRLLQHIEKPRHRPAAPDLALQINQTDGLGLGGKGRDGDPVLARGAKPDPVVLRQRRIELAQLFVQAGTDIGNEHTRILLKAKSGVIGRAPLVEIYG